MPDASETRRVEPSARLSGVPDERLQDATLLIRMHAEWRRLADLRSLILYCLSFRKQDSSCIEKVGVSEHDAMESVESKFKLSVFDAT